MKPICLALCLLPGLANAAEGLRDGVYDGYSCAAPVSDQRLTLRGNRISFYESACELRNPVAVRNMEGAHLFDAHCAGEGMEWETRYLLMHDFEGGLIIVGPQWAERHQRCD